MQSAQAAAEAATEAAERAAAGRIVTVFSTKGGVGKSLVATNTAVALADLGHNVCLVDLDVNNGDVAIMLQASPHRTVNDLVAFNGDIDEAAVESMLTQHSARAVDRRRPRPPRLPRPGHQRGRRQAARHPPAMFDFVVVDTSGSSTTTR